MKLIDVKKIKDYTEKCWWIGTDLLSEKDLELMDNKIGCSMEREEGALYSVKVLDQWKNFYKDMGYTQTFCKIMNEANRRGYLWIMFDRDIETESLMTFTYRINNKKNGQKGLFWEKINVESKEDLISSLEKLKNKGEIEVSPYFLNESNTYQEMSKDEQKEINNSINK